MFFKMLKAGINFSTDKNERNRNIAYIESLVTDNDLISAQDKKNLLTSLKFIASSDEEQSDEERDIVTELQKLTIENRSFLLINSILCQLKLDKKHNQLQPNILAINADKRFKKSEKLGISYEVTSYGYIDDEILESYGFEKGQWERRKEGISNIVIIRDGASNQEILSDNFLHMDQLKIWFPKKGAHPLGGILNELRLISQSKLYLDRNEQLTLLTDFSINENRDKEYVCSFCNKHGICLVTMDTIKTELESKNRPDKVIQLKLFECAMLELTHPAGHPVVASDILRLLSPVLKLGAYSDMDARIEYNKSGASDFVKLPELLVKAALEIQNDSKLVVTDLNNNFFYARNPEHAILTTHRKKIYSNYTSRNFISNLNLNHNLTLFGKVTKIEPSAVAKFRKFCVDYFSSNPADSPTNMLNFRQQLKNSYPQDFEMYFYFYVMALAGPVSLLNSLFPNPPITLERVNEISKFSLSNTPISVVDENSGKNGDMSWTDVGANRLESENKRITESVRVIQGFWRDSKAKTNIEQNDVHQNLLNL